MRPLSAKMESTSEVSDRVPGSPLYSGITEIIISGNALEATELDAIYGEIPDITPVSGYIYVAGNPGLTGDTPSTATSKYWNVIDS